MERFIRNYITGKYDRLKHRKDLIIGFDVDGTLIDEQDRPIYQNMQLLLWFVDRGYTVYVMSGGGIDYAETVVRKLGLEGIVNVVEKKVNNKIDIFFDDERVYIGKVNVEV